MNRVTTQAEYDERYPNVPVERWTSNVIQAVANLCDRENHAANWFREDRPTWENPNEVINALMDDCIFEDFLRDCDYSFTNEQRRGAHRFVTELNRFLDSQPGVLDSVETFHSAQWLKMQNAAQMFVSAFLEH